MVDPGFLTSETVQGVLLSVQAQQPLGEATPWDNTLGLPKSQIHNQNPVPDDAQRCSGRTEQVCKEKTQPDLLKPTPEFPADRVIDLPALGLLPGAGDSADGVS